MSLIKILMTTIDVSFFKQTSAHQAFTVDGAQTQQRLPMCQPSEGPVQRATFVNLGQHSHWAVEEELIIPMKGRLLALHALQVTFVLRTPLTSILTPAPRAITALMVLSMQHNIHAVKDIIMVLKKV